MAYRSAIETVLERCAALRSTIEAVEGRAVDPLECHTVGEALAWETLLDARLREADEFPPIERPARGANEREAPAAPMRGLGAATAGVVGAVGLVVLGALAIAVGLLESRKPAAPPAAKRSYLVTANVVTAHAPAHVGDRCTVQVELEHDACDVDVICPTVERRFYASACTDGAWISAQIPAQLDLDGRHGRPAFTTDREAIVELELDAWR